MDKILKLRSMDFFVENEVERVIFCFGKVYYDFDDECDVVKNIDRVKICCIE